MDRLQKQVTLKPEFSPCRKTPPANWASSGNGADCRSKIAKKQMAVPSILGMAIRAPFKASFLLSVKRKGKGPCHARIVTVPGKEGKIFIGDHIPVVTEKVSNGTTTTSTEYVDAGIRLSYTPIVGPDGVITASVHTEVSTPTPNFRAPQLPDYKPNGGYECSSSGRRNPRHRRPDQ